MCLEEIDRAKYQPQIALCGQFLLDNIKANGGFSYGDPTPAVPEAGSVASKKGDAFKSKKAPGPIDPNVRIKPVRCIGKARSTRRSPTNSVPIRRRSRVG